ncbi:MAG: hypothetical protein KAH62_00095 [Desulfobacula sp.]|nr:hypothetical protein [Desulfobacula sp.]
MKKLIALVAAMVMISGYAYAADWNFYGSARVDTTWTDTTAAGATSGVDQFSLGLQSNARIGANVKVSDELSGRFEYGSAPSLRLLYATWNFGSGSFVVGQAYTPLMLLQSNQIGFDDNDMVGWGTAYSGRKAQLKLVFGDFQIAAVTPDSNTLGVVGGVAENNIPQLHASYLFKMDNFSAKVAAGYDAYKINIIGDSHDVKSYVVAANATFNFGAGYLKGGLWAGDNAGALIYIDVDGSNMVAGGPPNDGRAAVSGTQVLDNAGFGYTAILGYKFSDMFAFEAGYGFVETELDLSNTENEASTYYVQSTVTLAPGVFFVPEFGKVDYSKTTGTIEDITYFAIKWQINF